jgi:hypothetical protein
MRAAIPTDLMLRYLSATPEQHAAIDRFLLAGQKPGVRCQELEPESEDGGPSKADVARQAFALLQKLELDAPLKAPSVLTVFRLYCVDDYSADRVARKCRCAKGTVMSRLRFIEDVTKTKPEEFRAVSSHLQQMDDEYNASGAREIYRRGLAKSVPD